MDLADESFKESFSKWNEIFVSNVDIDVNESGLPGLKIECYWIGTWV